ncbi:MAG: enolase C-terminal domain-like protein [Planctomyces sp.]|jgi:L-alanine-DL-glutamate epimerase-like enolase superfamily enzyme|nr:hypothetical protein [Planctomycetaceae bacterium]HBC63864.1 hypothetical protein [Planctomycetaceae bacterium]
MSSGKLTDVKVQEVQISFAPVPYRSALKFGGRVVSSGWLVNAQVVVESRLGQRATGYGSMPVGNVWAWPSAQLEPDRTEAAMKEFSRGVGEGFAGCGEWGHPLEIEAAAAGQYSDLAARTATVLGLSESPPVLAQLVAASPVDAAVHDAYGRLHHLNAFDTLSQQFCNRDLSTYLDERFRGEFADRYTLRAPASSLPLYHLVGALDPLTPEEAGSRPSDSLPWTLGEWILADQLTHLKIKLNGDQLDWDVERVLAIERVALQAQQQRGCAEWFYSCDFNEKCRSADYVVEFLRRIESASMPAFRRIQYIEQPTSRNLQAADAPDMHAAAAVKPVVIDEALISYESLLMARDQGYSGIALKACKGQSESILMAAAAQKFGMFLCVQDLTCPGASFLHSASLAAHIPGVAAVEGNSRQYCPAANAEWAARLPAAFQLRNGRIDTSGLSGVGLGFG